MHAVAWAALVSSLAAGCLAGEGTLAVPPGLAVPDDVYLAAAEHAVERVGAGYFERLYSVNATRSNRAEPQCTPDMSCSPLAHKAYWRVVFDFAVPGEDGMETFVEVDVLDDRTLAWDEERHRDDGLPDCRHDLRECRFPVGRESALRRARDDGLKERGCPLHASFLWALPEDHPATFAWGVDNGPCEGEGDAEGSYATVDANSGRILTRGGWFLISN